MFHESDKCAAPSVPFKVFPRRTTGNYSGVCVCEVGFSSFCLIEVLVPLSRNPSLDEFVFLIGSILSTRETEDNR